MGRALVADGLARDWDVTTFNRGTGSAPDGATEVHGDRRDAEGLGALAGLTFDLAVDTWSDEALAVDDAARALAAGSSGSPTSPAARSTPSPASRCGRVDREGRR